MKPNFKNYVQFSWKTGKNIYSFYDQIRLISGTQGKLNIQTSINIITILTK